MSDTSHHAAAMRRIASMRELDGLASEPAALREAARFIEQQGARIEAATQALHLLAGLHPCLTAGDESPQGQALAIFDAVQSDRREWVDQVAKLRALVGHLHHDLSRAQVDAAGTIRSTRANNGRNEREPTA